MNSPANGILRFGLFELDPRYGELRKRGMKIRVSQQAVKLLLTLLECPGQLRSREELRQRLWKADTFVDFEHSLNKAIHALRQTLGDSAESPRYIETVARQGYRFIQESSGPIVRPRNARKIDSLAVLPFASEAADPGMQFLTKRLVSRVIDAISRAPGIRVLAYSSVQAYQAKGLDPRAVGQNLLVRAVTVGELVRLNDDLLLHVELIDVSDGTQLWGAQFKEPYSIVLASPEKLAHVICDQLRLRLVPNHKKNTLRKALRKSA